MRMLKLGNSPVPLFGGVDTSQAAVRQNNVNAFVHDEERCGR